MHAGRVGRPPRPARRRAARRAPGAGGRARAAGRRGVRRGRAESAPIALRYRSSLAGRRALPARDADASSEPLLLDALRRVRRQEVERGVCLVGPHRDDLELPLGDGPAKGYASHGESWALALALRLASYRLLRADGVEPVLILDDVFAELDDRRRRALARVAGAGRAGAGHRRGRRRRAGGLGGVRFAVNGGRIECIVRRSPQTATSAPRHDHRTAVDKLVDTVDNFGSTGDEQRGTTARDRRPTARRGRSGGVVPRPGDGRRPWQDAHSDAPRTVRTDRANADRGADLAREALRAAREASAPRSAERAAERPGAARRPKGRRRRWSGSGPGRPRPAAARPARRPGRRWTAGGRPRLTDATVLGRWPQLVGPDIADHCTPLSLRDGELVLQAESTAWATQLRTLPAPAAAPARRGGRRGRRARASGWSGPAARAGGTGRATSGAAGPRDTYG